VFAIYEVRLGSKNIFILYFIPKFIFAVMIDRSLSTHEALNHPILINGVKVMRSFVLHAIREKKL
jgi:hypothetical protein